MAYYAVLELSIYYRCYLKVSIMLGLHKVRGTQNSRVAHEYSSAEQWIFRRNVSIRSNIVVRVCYTVYNFKAYICDAENNVFCLIKVRKIKNVEDSHIFTY
jgi:hypothetical protein